METDTPERPPARGEPFPFTQEQVNSLVRGEADHHAIRSLLRSVPQPALTTGPQARSSATPVPLATEELAQIQARGMLPAPLKERIRQTARGEAARPVRRSRKSRPDRKPD